MFWVVTAFVLEGKNNSHVQLIELRLVVTAFVLEGKNNVVQ